ncbi:hypothetical protein BGW39_002348 [Mortierella sp. 14UC]|nr:hypothetical protein BGW39_002348 [Mortierella sp. 14UC]
MKTSIITFTAALTGLISNYVDAASCQTLPQVNKPTLNLVKNYEKQSVDLEEARICLIDALHQKIILNTNQYGALVSWAYSIGCDDVKSSDLIKRLNNLREPLNKVVEQELPKWSEDGEFAVAEPVGRRYDEVRLFNTQSFDDALPCKK